MLKVGNDVLEKLETKLESLKNIYTQYSKFGDKLNYNKMNFTGFFKFLRDNDLIHIKKQDPNVTNQLNSNRSIKIPISKRSNSSTPQKIANSYLIKGKMIESEAFCVFCSLAGHKNFDNSVKYKNHFNQNKGYTSNLGESGRVTILDKNSSLSSSKSNVPMRMDFNLFVKSLEVVSQKLHPDKPLDEAVLIFLESVGLNLKIGFKQIK